MIDYRLYVLLLCIFLFLRVPPFCVFCANASAKRVLPATVDSLLLAADATDASASVAADAADAATADAADSI